MKSILRYDDLYRIILLGMLFFLIQCQSSETNTTAIQIGDIKLTKSQIELSRKILALDNESSTLEKAYYNNLKLLAQEYIATNNGMALPDTILSLEAQRIDKQSLRKEKIEKIKTLSGSDEVYKNTFVKMSLYPRWLKSEFDWNQSIHKEIGGTSKKLLSSILDNPLLLQQDSFKGFPIKSMLLDNNGFKPLQEQNSQATEESSNFIDQTQQGDAAVEERTTSMISAQNNKIAQEYISVLSKLKAEEIHPQALQTAEAFQIIQRVGNNSNPFKLRILTIPKRDYFTWLDQEYAQVPIVINDRNMWKQMLSILPAAEQQFRNTRFED